MKKPEGFLQLNNHIRNLRMRQVEIRRSRKTAHLVFDWWCLLGSQVYITPAQADCRHPDQEGPVNLGLRLLQSTQAGDQIKCAKMRVTREHAQLFVPRDGRDFDDVQPLLEQSRYCLMSKVVKVKAGDTSAATKMAPGLDDCALAGWESPTG